MKSKPPDGINKPFENLNLMLRKRVNISPAPPAPPRPRNQPALSPEQEARLFRESMTGVQRITDNRHRSPPGRRSIQPDGTSADDITAIEALESLVDSGQGFVISQTSEYMEAAGPGVGPEITRRLHQGRYAIQDHIDLHGYSAQAAQEALHAFVQSALEHDRRALLVIHGRGLTSPREPVLKRKVYEWLTRGPLRKHVIALTSARACDGGAGATYVLLRRQPLTKRNRRR
jgi:DNA-nicking Smr family endonuclease